MPREKKFAHGDNERTKKKRPGLPRTCALVLLSALVTPLVVLLQGGGASVGGRQRPARRSRPNDGAIGLVGVVVMGRVLFVGRVRMGTGLGSSGSALRSSSAAQVRHLR